MKFFSFSKKPTYEQHDNESINYYQFSSTKLELRDKLQENLNFEVIKVWENKNCKKIPLFDSVKRDLRKCKNNSLLDEVLLEISLEFAKKVKQNNDFEIHGLAVDNSLDSKLKDSKIFTKIHKNIKNLASHDIIFIDCMVKSRNEIIQILTKENEKQLLLVDFTPAKSKAIEWANKNLNNNISYVSAFLVSNRNIQYSKSENIFEDQKCLLMPGGNINDSYYKVLVQIIENIEMNPYFIEPQEFDSYYAATTLIPKLISFSLIKKIESSSSWTEMSNLANEEFGNLTIGSTTDAEDIFEILNSTTDLSKHWMKEIFSEISIINNKISAGDQNLLDYLINGWESRMRWELGITGSNENNSSPNILSSGQAMAGFLVSENLVQKNIDREKDKSKDICRYKKTK